MRWELLLSFLSAALIVQLVPGPGMLFILANGIAGGARAGVAAACSAATGRIGERLRRRASFRRAIERLAGTVMGGLGLRLLVSGRHS